MPDEADKSKYVPGWISKLFFLFRRLEASMIRHATAIGAIQESLFLHKVRPAEQPIPVCL
jgi:hypothetical protein